MKRKEPLASEAERASRILHIGRGSPVDLGSHGEANILCGEKIMLSFVDMPANSYADPHKHSGIEQVTMMLKGDADFVVEGKVFPVHEGDVLIFARRGTRGLCRRETAHESWTVHAPRPDLKAKKCLTRPARRYRCPRH